MNTTTPSHFDLVTELDRAARQHERYGTKENWAQVGATRNAIYRALAAQQPTPAASPHEQLLDIIHEQCGFPAADGNRLYLVPSDLGDPITYEDLNDTAVQPVQPTPDWVRNGIADFIADNWPDRKHTLSEIEAGIRLIEINPAFAPVGITGAPAIDQTPKDAK